ncbi:MAG TPA: HAD family phosphatase [Candidatus Limnocylindrales bacterium]|nr:HAD family phosphatase [Candidatus Limnocylindrales bacterium]
MTGLLAHREAVHPGTLVPARIRAVAFDMDGVLLDTETLWGRAEARLCAAHGTTYGPSDETATLGVLALDACRWYASRFGLPETAAPDLEAELLAYMAAELAGPVEPLPGAVALIERLRGHVRLAVASNSRRVVVRQAVERSGLREAFDALLSSDDVVHPKPAPDLYLLACSRLGVAPGESLALEDSAVGATAALAAGLSCYLVRAAPPPALPDVDAWIPSLVDLLDPRDASPRDASPRSADLLEIEDRPDRLCT